MQNTSSEEPWEYNLQVMPTCQHRPSDNYICSNEQVVVTNVCKPPTRHSSQALIDTGSVKDTARQTLPKTAKCPFAPSWWCSWEYLTPAGHKIHDSRISKVKSCSILYKFSHSEHQILTSTSQECYRIQHSFFLTNDNCTSNRYK